MHTQRVRMLGSLRSVMADSGVISLHSDQKTISRRDWKAGGSKLGGLNAKDSRKLSKVWSVWCQ